MLTRPNPPKTDDDDGNEYQGPTTTTHIDERHTTHPQPHEQLLGGWIAGGTVRDDHNTALPAKNGHRTLQR
jgi:hypothetical protein